VSRLPLLLHPATLVSLFVLVGNDHWCKYSHPGFVTGKASDFAGLVLLPMLLLGGIEAARMPRPSRTPWLVCGVVALAFAFAKLLTGPNALAGRVLGGEVLRDPWDLVALPALLVPLAVANLRANPAHAYNPYVVATSMSSPRGVRRPSGRPAK
jgi:hypothetical protein